MKQLKSTTQKCEGCGGNLIFSPKHQQLYCTKCEKLTNFNKSKAITKHSIADAEKSKFNESAWATENKVIACKTCGAKIVLNNLEYTTNCPYCGSSAVSVTTELPGMAPDIIIPFAFDEQDAQDKFLVGVKKKMFIPSIFKKKNTEKKIYGIYIPTFGFDADTSSNYSGVLIRVESYTGADGKTYSRDVPFAISGNKKLSHRDVTIESSSKIDQLQLESILPYDIKEAYDFDENFIRGYVVEHYNVDGVECHKAAKRIIDANIQRKILSQYSYDKVASLSIKTQYFNEKFLYKVSPIYMFEFVYKNKTYKPIMNGQTGKLGKGLPKSKIKITFFVLGIVAIVVAIILLIAFFGD